MNKRWPRIAAWGVLGAVLLIGAIVFVFDAGSPSLQPGGTPRTVSLAVTPTAIATGSKTRLVVGAKDAAGNPVDAWAGEVDAWLVRNDLTFLTHLVPDAGEATSSLTLPVLATEPGTYRLVVEDTDDTGRVVGSTTLKVTGTSRDAVPPAEQSANREGFKVTLATIPELPLIVIGEPTAFTYSVSRTGTPVSLEEYRGGRGMLAAFRESGAAFVRGNVLPSELLPSAAATTFTLTFLETGRYRVFFEFQANGRRYLDARWIEVRQ